MQSVKLQRQAMLVKGTSLHVYVHICILTIFIDVCAFRSQSHASFTHDATNTRRSRAALMVGLTGYRLKKISLFFSVG